MKSYKRTVERLTDRIINDDLTCDCPPIKERVTGYLKSTALNIGRRLVSEWARSHQEQPNSVLSHKRYLEAFDALTKGEAERRALLQEKYYPEYKDFLCKEGEAQPANSSNNSSSSRPVPDQLTIFYEGFDEEPLECD